MEAAHHVSSINYTTKLHEAAISHSRHSALRFEIDTDIVALHYPVYSVLRLKYLIRPGRACGGIPWLTFDIGTSVKMVSFSQGSIVTALP